MAGPHPTRRQALAGGLAALAGAAAGCSALRSDDSPDDPSYERLPLTAVYVDDGVDLAMPEAVQTVGATTNADLLLLPDDVDVGAEQAVEWLADERAVALLGEDAEAKWFEWVRSEAYDDTFGRQGGADSEPDPFLLVAAAVGTRVTTYRRSWGDDPRDRDLLRALDETLVDIEDRTPA